MAEEALRSGFTDFALTDHVYDRDGASWSLAKEEYPKYLEELYAVQKEYSGRIAILAGIEADWFYREGTAETGYEELRGKVEFTVGSVHYALSEDSRRFLIDGYPEEFENAVKSGFGGDIRLLVESYFKSYEEMIRLLKPDLAGHADIIRKNAQGYFTGKEPWYEDLAYSCAKALKEGGMVTEVNGGGNYRYRNGVVYPAENFLSMLLDAQVPLTVGLDAHSVDMVEPYYAESVRYLKRNGAKSLMRFSEGQWRETDIAEWLAQ
jgi:histidinol-phosphatase (PHP family)